MLICSVKTFKKQIIFLKKQVLLVWINQATYCLHCESVGSGKDAQCVQCWRNLNDGWCHEPAGKKNEPKEIHLLGFMSTLPGSWMSIVNYSFIFWIFFCKCANFPFLIQLFSDWPFLRPIIWCVCAEGDWTSAVLSTGSRGSSLPCF